VANQDGASVVVFRIDQGTGRLIPTSHRIAITSPVCIRFLIPGGAMMDMLAY
jgi:6-phosphogluconolactonase (cycloisomerase 2 family)